MYKIIGSDGRMYGPVTPEQLRQWMADGRANFQTLVQPAGNADWKPLAEFPELSPNLPGNLPPRVSPPRASTNSFAIASLVLGVGGWVLLCCGPVIWVSSIIFACMAISQINRSDGNQTGKGMAVAALVLSSIGLLGSICWTALWIPHITRYSYHGRYW